MSEPTGYVYFMKLECDENPYNADLYMKIGYAKDPEARLSVLKTGLPFDIDIDAAFRGSQADERQLHRKWAALRVRREWFRLGKELDAFVDELTDARFAIKIERSDPSYEPTLGECMAYRNPAKRLAEFIRSAAEAGEVLTLSQGISIRFEPPDAVIAP